MASATAVLLECTAEPGPAAYLRMVAAEYGRLGIPAEVLTVVVPAGSVGDEWAPLLARIVAADIVVIATPSRFGVRSSVARLLLERLAGVHRPRSEPSPLYNKIGGVVVTGSGDEARQSAGAMLRDLAALGCTIPPNADAYCTGDDPATASETARRMTRDAAHLARLLTAQPFPADVGTGDAPAPRLFAALALPRPDDIDPAAVDAERLAAQQDRLVERRRTLDLTRREKGLPENRKFPRPRIEPDAGEAGPPS